MGAHSAAGSGGRRPDLRKIPPTTQLGQSRGGVARQTRGLACALLVVNNLRDLPTDRDVNKRTLAVRLGDARTRVMFTTLVVAALASSVAIADLGALIALVVAVPALSVVRTIHSGVVGAELIPVLGSTGKLQLLFGVLLSVGLVIM